MAPQDRYYQILVNNLPGMLYRCANDAQWTMEFVSHGCAKLTGYDPSELLFNTLVSYVDLVHPDDAERIGKLVQRAIKENQPWTFEYRLITQNQGIKWVWEQGALIKDGDQEWLEGFITDISASKEREQQLKTELERQGKKVMISQGLLNQYKKAVDACAIVSKTDLHGTITYVNNEFCKISGYNRAELLGKNHNLIRSPNTPASVFKDLWQTIRSKKIWQGIIQNISKEGNDYFVSSTIVPLLNEHGDIQEYMSIRNDVTDLITKEQTILQQTTDPDTGLPNRIKLLEQIRKSDGSIHLAILNSPRLREINDFYSLDVVKVVSKTLATTFQKLIKNTDAQLFSLSTEEFGLLCENDMNPEEFLILCQSLMQYFDHNDIMVDDLQLHTPMVIGVASNKSKLLTHAEMALHKAMTSNKDFIYFNEMHDIAQTYEDNLKWTSELKDAIKEDRIEVFAQPIIANNGQQINKYECLLRMIGRDGEIISPFHFLDIACKARLYPTLTKIVIEKSFQHFANTDSEFSINLNVTDISHPETIQFLKDKLQEYGVAKQLILEVVESEGIENFDTFSEFIQDMKDLGCRIAIDDFGTGYSNFEYLMKLNADMVKIDGSLIKNLHVNETSLTITRLIVEFAQKLNMKVIAEFVHGKEVLLKVNERRIDYSQGFYLGEPVPFHQTRPAIESIPISNPVIQ